MAAGLRLRADMPAVHFAAGLRLLLLLGVVSIGSYGEHSPPESLWILLGLVGVPWATMVLFAAERPGSRWAVVGGPAGDALTLFAVHVLVPAAEVTVLIGYLVVVAFTAYTAGRAVAGTLAVLTISLVVAVESLQSGEQLDPDVVIAFASAQLALVYLLDRTAALQLQASDRSTRLEGKADAILARVADCVVVTDPVGTILQCNPAAERLIGRPGDAAVGRACSDVLGLCAGDEALDCDRSCALLALSDDESPLHEPTETWRLDHSGRRQPLLANAEAVIDERGRTVEVVHSLRDITRLKEADEAKTMFLATASHELKTPLTVIRGFADTLLTFDDFDPERRTAALQAIRIRSEELVHIVDRLLLSSRIEAGRVKVTLTRVALSPLLAERVQALQAATGREISLELGLDLPDVNADRQAVTTVVDHLLDNALKYSPGREAVKVRAHRDGDAAVTLEVEDAGIGMDAEQAASCFDRFWQAESSDVRRFGGTGIGLYIVRSLVEALGGTISVRSAPGSGSTFSVRLSPYRDGLAADARELRDLGEATSIREFMRQIGVPERSMR